MRKIKDKTDYAKELQTSFERWDHLYQYGGHDPCWSDGVNMNLVRNHISYYKKKIEATMSPDEYPAIYFREPPPEMPQDYMARADEIRESAKRVLSLYLDDKDRLYLEKKLMSLSEKDIKSTCIINVLNYAESLKTAIQEDDLITMRRHENPEGYMESFAQCAERVKNIRPPNNEQLSLFSFVDDKDTCDMDEENEMTMEF